MPPSLSFAAVVEVGGYISIWKCAVLLVVVLIWARLLTWTDKDAEAAHLPRSALNTGFMLGLVLALLLFFFLPGFFVALAALVVILAIEVIAYLVIRNNKVGLKDLGDQFRDWLAGFKGKGKKGKAVRGDVALIGKSGAPIEPIEEGEGAAAEKAGYEALQEIFTDPLRKGADRVELAAAEGRSAVRFWVDGVGYEGLAIAKNDAGIAINMLKDAMGLDTSDRRKPQMGTLKATIDGKKHELRVLTAGSTAGESIAVDVNVKSRHEVRLESAGFTKDQLAVMQEVIAEPGGIVLLAAPKGQGLTTLEYAILRAHDAFLTHIQTVERAPDIELEGITQNELPSNPQPGEEAKLVSWVVSQEPEVIMIGRLEDPRSAADLIKFASTGKRAYIGLRAGSTFDALAHWRKLVGDDRQATKHLRLVVAGRVVRKLCEACKIDYAPDPDTLRKLNMSPDKVGKLYTARTSPLKDSRGNVVVCEFCQDMRFRGRSGIYEIFAVDDEVRTAIARGGSINELKMLFKKQKRRYLQEAALIKAVAGETSLQEVARVMKAAGDTGTSGTGTSGGGGSPRPTSGGRPTTSGGRPTTSGGGATPTKRPASSG
jgi:general secretion pathway protein E